MEEPGIYQVTVSNECESVVKNITVELEANGQEDFIYIPNIFSPNNDGINDWFLCSPADNVEILDFEMQVFDRWGAKIFESKNSAQAWDGTFKEEVDATGVYIYWLRAKILACKREIDVFRKGDVAIVR